MKGNVYSKISILFLVAGQVKIWKAVSEKSVFLYTHTRTQTPLGLVMERGKQWLVNSCLYASYPEVLWVNEQSLLEGRGGQGGKGERALHGRKPFMVFPGILGMQPSPPPEPLGWRLKILFFTCLWGCGK